MIDIRSNVLNSYTETIESSFQEKQAQIKLINYGTGSGKTYQFFHAMDEIIKKYPNIHIIGIYVAPLREHLQTPKEFAKLLSYKINSLEMKMTSDFIRNYKDWIGEILQQRDFWKIENKKYSKDERQYVLEKKENAQKSLHVAKSVINRLEIIRKMDIGDEDFKSNLIKTANRDLNNCIETFLVFLIRYKPNQDKWLNACLELMKIFFPLYLLRNESGVVMLTYNKLNTKVPYFKHNGKKWVKKNDYLNKYIKEYSSDSKRFILAFDEQEDGYQIILNNDIDIISPQSLAINNALSSIYREFPILFSDNHVENRKFLMFLEKEPNIFQEFEEHLEKGMELSPSLQKHLSVYKRLSRLDGNSNNFLEQLVKIEKGFQRALKEVIDVFEEFKEGTPFVFDFEMLVRTISIFGSNRSFLIPSKLYREISNELMNIFSYNNLYIYNVEPLKELFLMKSSGGHVHISKDETSDKTSMAELIYALFVVRFQINAVNRFLENVLNAEDSQSRSLDIWSKQINKVQKAIEENDIQQSPSKYLNRLYVYESYKSIVNILEIDRYQHSKSNLINPIYREISIGSTTILTSPEHKLMSILEGNNNVIFLISATGGITGDLSTSYDVNYLEDNLRNDLGQSFFRVMEEKEIVLCEQIRENRLKKRDIKTSFFGTDFTSFPNQKTKKVIGRFEAIVLNKFIKTISEEKGWLSIYKIQELQNFIRFLFYLFEDKAIQETIAFTQTLNWIKELIGYWRALKNSNFLLTESKEHPSIFYVEVKHPSYRNDCRIKLILYDASFNKNYIDKAIQKTYLDELVEKEGQKIFFLSAYQSAAKGLNPIINSHLKKEFQKDFDSLVLLMDSYYSVMSHSKKKSKETEKTTTFQHFAIMKHIVNISGSDIEIKDFNKYLSQYEAAAFQKQQHEILLGKGILQATGRTERREFESQTVKIFINEETRKNLVNFYKYLEKNEPNEIRKFSVNNYEVYLRVQEDEKQRILPNYDEHVDDEIDAYLDFHKFREKMLEQIGLFHQSKHTLKVKEAWDLLRDSSVFKKPTKYLDLLHKSKLFPSDFIDALFYCPTDKLTFTPHLATAECEGKKLQIISDSVHGEKIYPYLKRLYPDYLKTSSNNYDLEGSKIKYLDFSTNEIRRLHKTILPKIEVFDNLIPRPDFFYDILYPSFTEHFTERWIHEVIFKGKDWKFIKRGYSFELLSNFRKYKKLYEKFDLYYTKGDTLFCIDVKAWSKISGNKLSQKTLNKTQKKLNEIISNYPEFKKVKGLLLNLYAKQEKRQQHSANLFSGNLIYFDNQYLPVASIILEDFLTNKFK